MTKHIKATAPFTTKNGAALLGEGATVFEVGIGEATADGDLVGDVAAEEAETLSTLISTFCPAWQWPGAPHKKK